jgi:hypothetical protein
LSDQRADRSKDELLASLRRVNAPDEVIRAFDAEFGDQVDRNEAANFLLRYGMTLDWATSRMGGSP